MNDPILSRVPLFATLPASEIKHLQKALRRSEIPANSILFHEGERGDRLYIVLDGEVEIVQALGTADERLAGVRGPGEYFGEMSLLNRDALRTMSVRARTPVQLLEMARADFDGLLHRQPVLAYAMASVLSARLQESSDATIRDLHEKNRQLARANEELKAAQAQIIEKEKLEHELQLAREIQESILPRSLPQLGGFDFGARIAPARSVAVTASILSGSAAIPWGSSSATYPVRAYRRRSSWRWRVACSVRKAAAPPRHARRCKMSTGTCSP